MRSLKRSSGCGARTVGVRVGSEEIGEVIVTDVGATDVAGATDVSDDELPHNS